MLIIGWSQEGLIALVRALDKYERTLSFDMVEYFFIGIGLVRTGFRAGYLDLVQGVLQDSVDLLVLELLATLWAALVWILHHPLVNAFLAEAHLAFLALNRVYY